MAATTQAKRHLEWTDKEEILLYKHLIKHRPYLVQCNGELKEICKSISLNISLKTNKTFSTSYLLDTYKKLHSPPSSDSLLQSDIVNDSLLHQLKMEYLRNETNWNNLSAERKKQKLQMMAETKAHITKLLYQNSVKANGEGATDIFKIARNFLWLIETKTVDEIRSILGASKDRDTVVRTTFSSTTGVARTIDLLRLILCVSPLASSQEIKSAISRITQENHALLNELLELFHCNQLPDTQPAANAEKKAKIQECFTDMKSFVANLINVAEGRTTTAAAVPKSAINHILNTRDCGKKTNTTPPPPLLDDARPFSEKIPLLEKQRQRVKRDTAASIFETSSTTSASHRLTPPPHENSVRRASPVKSKSKVESSKKRKVKSPYTVTSAANKKKTRNFIEDDFLSNMVMEDLASKSSKKPKVSSPDITITATKKIEETPIQEDFISMPLQSKHAIMYEEGQIKLQERKLALQKELLSVRKEELALKVKMYELHQQDKQ